MKVSAKPISSPGRTEKFPIPPPLMRFLRSNTGSKSRGRSRSSPMFLRRKNASAAATETQEPTSPKVTCIGQVRVRRASKSDRPKVPARRLRPCFWCLKIRKTLFCTSRRFKPRSLLPSWRKWVLFFRFGYCRKSIVREDSSKMGPNRKSSYKASETEEEEEEDEEDIRDRAEAEVQESREVFVSSTPPRNAFLLTRCRSAPYRSSSLASRFWEDEAKKVVELEQQEEGEEGETEETPPSDLRVELRRDEEIQGDCAYMKEFGGSDSVNGSSKSEDGAFQVQELEALKERLMIGSGSGSGLPLILTRCKSEPARTGDRLNRVPTI